MRCQAFTLRRIKFLLRRALRFLGRASGTAHQIALGVAIGFFVGWLPIVGIQMAVAVVVCASLRANKVVPIFPIWLTNPATIIPIYSFNYWVGWKLVGGPPLSELVEVLKKMIPTRPEAIPDATWDVWFSKAFANWWDGVAQALGELLAMGWNMQLPLWLGCVIVGLCLAVPSYYLTRKFVASFREAVVKKRQQRHDRRRRDAGVDVSLGVGYNKEN